MVIKLSCCNLRTYFNHSSFTVTVHIFSFGQDSLQSFAEELDIQYKTFFVTEKRKPVNVSTPSAASSDLIVSPKAKRRKLPDQTISKVHILLFQYLIALRKSFFLY